MTSVLPYCIIDEGLGLDGGYVDFVEFIRDHLQFCFWDYQCFYMYFQN